MCVISFKMCTHNMDYIMSERRVDDMAMTVMKHPLTLIRYGT